MTLKKISDLFNFEKGVLQSSKCTDGEYNFITASSEWKKHNEYTHDCEALIFAAAASGSLGRTHYVNGKFVSSDLCFIITPKDAINYPVDLEFYHIIFNLYKTDIVNATKAGTSKEAIGLNVFGKYELPYFDIKKQTEIKTRFAKIEIIKNRLFSEYANQLTQLTNLNQTILQEAVQGKLVPQNPKDEPAEKLLKRIKSQKEKSGKKENPLAHIKPEEIPFEIPKNWVWCRLGDAVQLKRGKSKHRPRNDSKLFINGTYPFIQTGDVSKAKNNSDLITTINGYYNDFGLKQSEMQEKGTLCITIAANIAECGFLGFNSCVPDSIVCLLALDKSIERFVYHYLKLAKVDLERFAPATAQKNINLGILNDLLIPFPPLEEQKRIVVEIEKQLAKTKELKEHVLANQVATEQLLKALLHEAFEVKEETKVIKIGAENNDTKKLALAAEIAFQLHKEKTFGHVKFMKILYLSEEVIGMQLGTKYLKMAAGPFDPKFLNLIDAEFPKKKWFDVSIDEKGGYRYIPLENVNEYKDDFKKYFFDISGEINKIIILFRTQKSDHCEIVATLYYVWKDLVAKNTAVNDDILIEKFYKFHKDKAKYTTAIILAKMRWMINNNIVPAL